MKYILEKEEYDALVSKANSAPDIDIKELKDICQKACDHIPVDWGRGDGNPKPWGCLKSKDYEWYCDECPVEKLCPELNKHWSK